MLKTVTLKALTPWPQFNEYEGEVLLEVGGRELTCHVVLSSAQEWKHGELAGTVLDIRAERLTVDAGFPLSVDLETGANEAGGAP